MPVDYACPLLLLSFVLQCMLQQGIWGAAMAHCVHMFAIAAWTHASTASKPGHTVRFKMHWRQNIKVVYD